MIPVMQRKLQPFSTYVIHIINFPVSPKHPLLFVHGDWTGAWIWEDFFMPYFAARGTHFDIAMKKHLKQLLTYF